MMTLSWMAELGRSEMEIFTKALSFGVTEPTARSYVKQLYARGQL